MLPLDAKTVDGVTKTRIKSVEEQLHKQEGSIYSILSEIQWLRHEISDFRSHLYNHTTSSFGNKHGCSCDEMISRIAAVEHKFDSKFDKLTTQVTSSQGNVGHQLNQLALRLNAAENRFGSNHQEIHSRIDSAEHKLNLALNAHRSQYNSTKYNFESRIDMLLKQMNLSEHMLSSRLNELETEVEERSIKESKNPDNGFTISNDVLSRVNELFSRLNELSLRVDTLVTSSGPPAVSTPPRDCSDLPTYATSGVHQLALGPATGGAQPTVAAYCDLHKDGGRWTVIQRRARIRPLQKFNRLWAAYKKGFGQLHGEFWWGLENMFQMTRAPDRQYELLVNLMDAKGTRRHALYGQFKVDSELNGYRLTVTKYTGDAGDSLEYHNGCKFSTRNKDQDLDKKRHCARQFRAGWWYRACQSANLNGQYFHNKRTHPNRIRWNRWPSKEYSIREVEMKIRPVKTA